MTSTGPPGTLPETSAGDFLFRDQARAQPVPLHGCARACPVRPPSGFVKGRRSIVVRSLQGDTDEEPSLFHESVVVETRLVRPRHRAEGQRPSVGGATRCGRGSREGNRDVCVLAFEQRAPHQRFISGIDRQRSGACQQSAFCAAETQAVRSHLSSGVGVQDHCRQLWSVATDLHARLEVRTSLPAGMNTGK